MTPVSTEPDARGEGLFIADFCPRLGAYLASQHARGYDAVAARARFVLWLGVHADGASRLTAEEEAELAARIVAGRHAGDSLAAGGALPAGGADELAAAERRLIEAVGRNPSPEELAAELDLPGVISLRGDRPG